MQYRPQIPWRRVGWQLSVVVGCLSLTAYFAHHAMAGRYGVNARAEIQARAMLLDFEAERLQLDRVRLRQEILLLSAEPPNPDLVAEIARDVLGYAHPSEKVIQLR